MFANSDKKGSRHRSSLYALITIATVAAVWQYMRGKELSKMLTAPNTSY